jgi:ubiquitin-protein ligase
MSTSNRLIKEFSDLKKEKDLNFKLIPDEKNLHKWNGVLNGPSGTPYQVSIKIKCCK